MTHQKSCYHLIAILMLCSVFVLSFIVIDEPSLLFVINNSSLLNETNMYMRDEIHVS